MVDMTVTLWAWIQEQQTLTAGILGFVGVILTLLFNAWQERKQRREERRHECQTLRTALIEELSINRAGLDSFKDAVKEITERQGLEVPTDLMDDVYKVLTDRIGLLSQAEVRKVMYAYLSMRTYNVRLFLVGNQSHTSSRHVQVPPHKFPELFGMQETLIGRIDEAVEVMERACASGA